jgi:hypothetical protein
MKLKLGDEPSAMAAPSPVKAGAVGRR